MPKVFFISLALLFLPCLVLATDATSLENPLAGINNILQSSGYIGGVISRVLAIVGALALLMMVYGGLSMILAAGNETKITQGKNIVTYTAVGLIVIFISYSAITFFLKTLGGTIVDEYRDLPVSPASVENVETNAYPEGPAQPGQCPLGCVITSSCFDPSQPSACMSSPGCCVFSGE